MRRLRFWVQKVLPLVYDDSLSYYELLNKVVAKLNEMIGVIETIEGKVDDIYNSNLRPVVADILSQWLEDGTLADIITDEVLDSLDRKIDLAITESKLTQNTSTPIYVGDYLALFNRYLPSTVAKVGSRAYCFDAVKETYGMENMSDTGRVLIYSLSSNVLEREVPIYCGHCNSVAYDTRLQRFFIAPVFTYATGNRQPANTLITYDESFSVSGTVNMPAQIMSVSFDGANEQLYALGYNKVIYKYDYANNLFVAWSSLNLDNVDTSISGVETYNQDFAVYNNQFFVSAPRGNVLTGVLKEGISTVTFGFNVGHACNNNNFFLGELEGFEFDIDGHLFANMYTQLTGSLYNGFMVEIQTGITPPYIPDQGGVYAVSNETLELRNWAEFRLPVYRIRSINQVHMMNIKPTRVLVPAGVIVVEPAPVIIFEGYMLTIEGRLEVPSINVDGARLNIYASANGVHELKIDNGNGIYISRNGDLKLTGTGGYSLNLIIPNNKAVTLDTSFPQTTVRNLPVSADYETLLIGGQELKKGVYWGEQYAIDFSYLPG